ncbi:ABC transporter permease [Cohnella sp. CIP 111063]|jgi:multiple sugar transport system permease protein|uniref:carbohydrate ABC transporter permease n=1 Tax=unclassified Cohnella TaxID=2636738 RepID=UPI000B8C14AA|nr:MULTISPECIES: carbohydrate ABC transporter permease [unclassified Cohnella]OXS54028.1 ABC transporter permease [Cohnella sp. CIP 111063]PRX62900.1 carbohydrate ABC transporter membrane protein 2 (CUT1 family) [Cohnella sp. SGD-V74]
MRAANRFAAVLRNLLLAAAAIAMAFPFYWMATSALKTNDEIWRFPPTLWPQEALWSNFADAWQAAPFARYMFNSVFVAGTIVVLQILNSGMMAYALTHMRFRLKGFFTALVLVGYMVPATAVYLPGYVILGKLHLLNTYAGLIVSNSVSVFSIFLIRQAFLQVSHELVEAGKVDGASHLRILWTIIAPLTRSSFAVLALIAFIEQYNNYFWPMLITKDPDLQLVSAGLRSFFVEGGAYGLKWPLIMAASAFTIAPLLALFLVGQRTIMRSVDLAAGASKG